MATYLAFLRAINLGATRKFPKDDIRRAVEAVGFTGVETHLTSGNVRFDCALRSPTRIAQALERSFAADRGFDVPTVVYSTAEFAAIADDARELGSTRNDLTRHFVYLLPTEPDAQTAAAAEATSSGIGDMVVRGRAAHALLGPAYRTGQVDPLGAAKHLGVATVRTAAVVTALEERWCRA